jgi:hypothetical protein
VTAALSHPELRIAAGAARARSPREAGDRGQAKGIHHGRPTPTLTPTPDAEPEPEPDPDPEPDPETEPEPEPETEPDSRARSPTPPQPACSTRFWPWRTLW